MLSTSFAEFFCEVSDPRMQRKQQHPLINILFISICSVICGATSFVDIQDFGKAKKKWLSLYLDLTNGIPSHDTFNRVFSILNPEEFSKRFMEWTHAISE